MNTITAKELRDDLRRIVKRVRRGERIKLSYREEEVLELRPLSKPAPRKKLSGLDKLLKELVFVEVDERYKTGSIKKLYQEDMAKKYGVQ